MSAGSTCTSSRCELEAVAREAFETAVILGEAGGLTVTMPVIEPATVAGDPTRLRQLFLNLITNAIKYTPRGGSVELTLESYGKTAAFSVRDTGVGIAAGDLPHIFERFWRADRARSRPIPSANRPWVAERGGLVSGSRSDNGLPKRMAAPSPCAPGSAAAARSP